MTIRKATEAGQAKALQAKRAAEEAARQAEEARQAAQRAAEEAKRAADQAQARLDHARGQLEVAKREKHSPRALEELGGRVRQGERDLAQAQATANAAQDHYNQVAGTQDPRPYPGVASSDGFSTVGNPDLEAFSGQPPSHHPLVMGNGKDAGDGGAPPGKATEPPPYPVTFVGTESNQTGTHDLYRMEIEGQKIIIAADKKALEAGTTQATPQEMASAIAGMPPELRTQIRQVNLSSSRSPDDGHWAQAYNTPGFRSYMNAGSSGVVNVFPKQGDRASVSSIRDSLMHETGHVWSGQEMGDDPHTPQWAGYQQAIDDDRRPVSDYGQNSPAEDIGDFTRMYFQARNAGTLEALRAQYPHRTAFFEKELRDGSL